MADTPEVVKKVEHKNIHAALSAFQGELTPIEQSAHVNFKTKAGDTVDFRYAPLGETMKTIYPILARHGLAVRHELTESSIEAILTHETTEQREVDFKDSTSTPDTTNTKTSKVLLETNCLRSGKLAIDTKKVEMKEVGAQITYARRYTLGLVLGLATEEDKDAELFEESRKNVEEFAFKQAKDTIEKAKGDKLSEQVKFLEKELALATALEAGEGTKAPSLGLKASQYQSLLTIAKAKVGKKDDAPIVVGGAGGSQEGAGGGGGGSGEPKEGVIPTAQ